MYYVIRPLGGFGNRIRVVFSYLIYCLQNNKKLYVIWRLDDACNGYYLDYFIPIPNVIFKTKKIKTDYQGEFAYKCSQKDYLLALKLLIPKTSLQKEIDEKKGFHKYNAFHVRRTDHIKLAKRNKKFTTDEEFFNFISISKLPVYGAFDNYQTQKMFLEKYPAIRYNILIPNNNLRRKTLLKDSIIDIFVCRDSELFFPSGYSSFSDLIMNLRKSITL